MNAFVTNTYVQKGFLLSLIYIFLLLPVDVAIAQVDTSYLRSLEDEASHLSLDKKTTPSANGLSSKSPRLFSNDFKDDQGGALVGLSPGLSVEQFEQVLKNNYIGSYLFYERLSDSKKTKVYNFYQTNPDPNQLRQEIIKVSKQ